MASITLKLVPWAPGTSVGAYPRRSEVLPETGAPGTALETQTVAADASLTYTTLANGEYRAAAPISGTWRYVSFNLSPPSTAARLDTLETSVARRRLWIPGAIAETIPRLFGNDLTTTLLTGQPSLVGGAVIPAGVTVTNIAFRTGATPVGAPTNQFFFLTDQSRVILAKTVDDTTTAWGANTTKVLALSAPYTPTVDTPVYIGILVAATTVPSLRGQNSTSADLPQLPPIFAGRSSTTSITTPASLTSVGALSASTQIPYAYLT